MLVLAHRGASVAAPENTPEAFSLADTMGADGVELDVRWIGDGRLLVAHDQLPLSVAAVDAMALPTLDEVLDACGDRMLVNVEIKNWPTDTWYDPSMEMVGPVIDTLRRRGTDAAHRWLISCFHWATIEACRVMAPDIPTAWLMYGVRPERIDQIAAAGHAAVHPQESAVTAELVDRCHDAGLAVNSWTSNDPDRLAALAAMGVDGVCTDVPDVALAALGRSPQVSPRWSDRSPAAR
jgi:glycerophosphoryl diester phosphodiesterase